MITIADKIGVNGSLLKMISLIVAGVAAYLLTIQSIKLELAGKADHIAVQQLDKKLSNIELMLKESLVSREQFYIFSRDCEARLGRIEFYLTDQAGEDVGRIKRKP